jgi:hypothetical protein
VRRSAVLVAAWLVAAAPLAAQRPDSARLGPIAAPLPSTADQLLASGRLAAAEDALYAAADARPRAPEPRGALAMYLASRARFRIAEILFEEAMRFGADAGQVRRALALLAPYRLAAPAGPEVTVALSPVTDARALWGLGVEIGGTAHLALFDPAVSGLVVGRATAQSLGLRGRGPHGLDDVRIGGRRLARLGVAVDSLAAPDELRIGLDALWSLHPLVDERSHTLTLGRAPAAATLRGRVEQVPFVLTFPGLLLVPTVGRAPIGLESASARALLRGTVWQLDAATATLIVQR